ncbi:unnamed protein product [Adineta ricciae]|uniref:Uncharacterized protein n=1 Tax=Adineta ricciae TaxID=249248 RepID=A0A815NZK8_ADIRI|nr:unnamed protein product [Adineta ricciae]CAF1442978.1 unnamed protein product [Adineta ricciae]
MYTTKKNFDHEDTVTSQHIEDNPKKNNIAQNLTEIKTLSLKKLFRYATSIDIVFMMIGTVAALVHGSGLPLLILIFGHVLDSFTDQAKTICSINVTSLSQQYCPDSMEFTSINIGTLISQCNITYANFTLSTSMLTDTIQKQVLYLVAVGCIIIVVAYVQVSFWIMSAENQSRAIRQTLFQNILHKDMSFFDTHKIGELDAHLSQSVSKIQDGIGHKIGTLIQFLASLITGFIIGIFNDMIRNELYYYRILGFSTGWKLSFVILSTVSFIFLPAAFFSWLATRLTMVELQASGKAAAVVEEVLSSIRTVFAFNGQDYEIKRYGKHLEAVKKSSIKKTMTTSATMSFVWLIIYCTYALGFWYGAKLVRDGEYTSGQVFTTFFAIIIGIFQLGQAAPHIQALVQARATAFIVWQLIDAPCTIISNKKIGLTKKCLMGDIQFSEVCFRYPSRPDTLVLNRVSFDIKPGQTIALVGSSGSGKSTCVHLLTRFYDPHAGSIKIDGISIKDYDLEWLRQQIGVVNQEPILFHGTIRDNILLGKQTATDQELEEAAKMANAHDFIMNLPQKYETQVDARGATLSGGQKQRIAIARALIGNPQILLLDEATSALDNESEKVVQEALRRAAENRTMLIIAHRLSTIRDADKIVVMHQGAIVEEGTHASLTRLQGIYYNLIKQNKLSETRDILEHHVYMNDESKEKRTSDMIPSKIMVEEEVMNRTTVRENTIWTILKINKPEWLLLLFGSLIAFINGANQPIGGILLSKMFSIFQECSNTVQEQRVLTIILLLLGLGVFTLIVMSLQNYLFIRSGEALVERLRLKLFDALLHQEIAYFDEPENNTGALCNHLANDTSAAQGVIGIYLSVMCQNAGALGVGLLLGFVFSWQLTLLVIGFLPLNILGGLLQSRLMTGFERTNNEALVESWKISLETIQNIRTVVQLTKEKYFYEQYQQCLDTSYRSSIKRAHIFGLFYALSTSTFFFTLAALFALGAFLVEKDQITLEDVLLVFNCIVFGAQSIGQNVSMVLNFGPAKRAAKNILDVLTRQPIIDNRSSHGEHLTNFQGQIEFNHLYFTYASRSEAVILQNFNLNIEPGQKVALVGTSGSGKSTIIQLLERFYDATAGSLLIDGTDIRKLDLQWYRSQISLVSQEPVLFDMSIRENIAYGDTSRENISLEEIIQVAQKTNIHEFIQQLPEGYETQCGAKGIQLSGGQKQRIAIARALIRNPKILLLDEATSALDTQNEQIVQDVLERAQENRTSICIAHRMSTIQNANLICVIHNGIVVEKGTHRELLALQGHYHRLVEKKLN